ncbi:MAG TPA: M15 family metallopeptidase, partial [Nocardioides sp.]|nr:M15 family metallopeptidase [Nocardioides sp.]
MRTLRVPLGALLATALLLGCAADPPSPRSEPGPRSSPRSSTTAPTPAPSSPSDPPTDPPTIRGTGPTSRDGTLRSAAYGRGSVRPPWLFERALPERSDGYGVVRPTPPALRRRAFTLPDTVPMLPGRGYASRIVSPAPRAVVDRSTWEPGCPVAPDDLAWLRLTFWGFDAERHTGELLTHATVARDLDTVFRRLWESRFPMEQVGIVETIDEDAPPTGDGNGTGSFVCRAITGGSSYSQHAYGLAVDVNTFQNPYAREDLVIPELASAYLDRDRVRPG